LPDTVNEILDRVLNGHDVAAVVVDAPESGVQRGRFTRTGGSGDQDDTVRFVNQAVDGFLRYFRHTQRCELESTRLFVEESQYDPLAVAGGHR